MVNECTSRHNASYTTHVTDSVIPFMTRYYNLCTTGFYNIDTNRQGILDSWIIRLMKEGGTSTER